MTNNKKAELISETTLRYAIYRFGEGIKQIKSNYRKQAGALVILALALLCHVLYIPEFGCSALYPAR